MLGWAPVCISCDRPRSDSIESIGPMKLRPLLRAITAILVGICAAVAHAQLLRNAAPSPSVVTTERTRAELLAHAPDGLGADKPVWLGLRLTHQAGWKSYWLNPGDAGLPTRMQWSLPAGHRR